MFLGSRSRRPGRRTLTIAALLLALPGCASENAQQLALTTLKALAQYEQEVDKKIAAEKTYYKDQAQNIRNKLAGTPITADNAHVTDTDIKKTWIYGHIRTSGVLDSRRSAGEILSRNKTRALTVITDYVAKGVNDNDAAIAEIRARQADLARRLVKNLQPIEKQKKRLTTLRKGLTSLAAAPDDKAKLSQVKAIAEVLFKEIQKKDDTP